jgi:hypothetical protein
MIHGIDEDSSFTVEGPWSLININNNHQFLHDMHAGDVPCTGIVRAVDKWLGSCVDSCVEIHFIAVLAS